VAHTLKAYYRTDPATAVTVDFMGAIADNDGIALDSYQMGIPGIEQARNNSLYSDSPTLVYAKHTTVTDVLTVTVRGSTNTNLYTNLHLLAKLGEFARDWYQPVKNGRPPYLEFKPGGSAAGEVLYATIYDCRVELPADWANNQDATLTIENVTVTIEREIWHPGANTTNISTTLTESNSGSASTSVAIAGDMAPLYYLEFFLTAGATTAHRLIVGYRSKSAGGTNYASLGKKEAESQTNGTDTSDAADATASGGNKVACTFGTATLATRLSGTGIPYGVHRVFARMKTTSTAVATVNIKYQDTGQTGVVYKTNSSISVSSTSWLVYDLGVVKYFTGTVGALYSDSSAGVWSVDALLASGAGNLDIDYLYFMPTENYITLSGASFVGSSTDTDIVAARILDSAYGGGTVAQVIRGSTYAELSPIQYTASFRPLTGHGCLYWLVGVDNGSVFDVLPESYTKFLLETLPRYIMPSVV